MDSDGGLNGNIYQDAWGVVGCLILKPRERAHHPHQPTPVTGISRTLNTSGVGRNSGPHTPAKRHSADYLAS